MISKSNVKYICENRELVENYKEALSDSTQMWDLHHRLETHFSDGGERPSNAFLSKEELIALDMYWHRPPEELIFLRKSDHYKLHGKCEQHKRKISIGKGGDGNIDMSYYDKHREDRLAQCKKYYNRICCYNGENLTLCALAGRFRYQGIQHSTQEAKKYLLDE